LKTRFLPYLAAIPPRAHSAPTAGPHIPQPPTAPGATRTSIAVAIRADQPPRRRAGRAHILLSYDGPPLSSCRSTAHARSASRCIPSPGLQHDRLALVFVAGIRTACTFADSRTLHSGQFMVHQQAAKTALEHPKTPTAFARIRRRCRNSSRPLQQVRLPRRGCRAALFLSPRPDAAPQPFPTPRRLAVLITEQSSARAVGRRPRGKKTCGKRLRLPKRGEVNTRARTCASRSPTWPVTEPRKHPE